MRERYWTFHNLANRLLTTLPGGVNSAILAKGKVVRRGLHSKGTIPPLALLSRTVLYSALPPQHAKLYRIPYMKLMCLRVGVYQLVYRQLTCSRLFVFHLYGVVMIRPRLGLCVAVRNRVSNQ